ncbi:25924_t:CDS:2 [Gigaspora margarita]|uniref:25924_t:CDS:1 n=1 Tax=Gigaspora margarita TaxID=4874 RepID=A0ABM8W6C2_GIGMA|nr:25924_t:CDS:2 [Gigaspora margarita]
MSNASEAPVCDIKFSDLEIIFENSLKGGFGEVYKGTLRGHNIAAKYVKRETPTNLKDFNRELKALRLSEKCKSNIIKFFGLSHGKIVYAHIIRICSILINNKY